MRDFLRRRFYDGLPNPVDFGLHRVPGLCSEGEGDEGGGGGGGSEGGGSSTEDLTKLQQWHETQTVGLRRNRDDLKSEKLKVETELKDIRKTLEGLGDIERLQHIAQRFENDEEMKLIEDGKFDEVLERRTENLVKDYDTKLTASHTRIEELEKQLSGKAESMSRLKIDAQVREIGTSMDPPINALALPDAVRYARDIWALDEEDNPVARNSDGTPIIGKDGKSALGMDEWLTSLFEAKKTLWWGQSSGGGATGGGNGNGVDPDEEALSKMSPRDKLRYGRKQRANSG